MHDDREGVPMVSDSLDPGGPGGTRLVVLASTPSLRRRLCSRLVSAGFLVVADDPGDEARGLVEELHPDMVIVECREFGGPAFDVTTSLIAACSGTTTTPLWMALVDGDPLFGAAAWAAGFDEVLSLPHDPHHILGRIEAMLARRHRRGRVHLGDVTVDLDGHEVWRGQHRISLTTTEFRLLVALLRHRQQVLSKRQLLNLVWGFDDYDTNVVEVHVCALRRKLEAVGPRLVHTVRGAGYVARQGAPTTSTLTP
jgi:two-component system, OmpR family, response regulator